MDLICNWIKGSSFFFCNGTTHYIFNQPSRLATPTMTDLIESHFFNSSYCRNKSQSVTQFPVHFFSHSKGIPTLPGNLFKSAIGETIVCVYFISSQHKAQDPPPSTRTTVCPLGPTREAAASKRSIDLLSKRWNATLIMSLFDIFIYGSLTLPLPSSAQHSTTDTQRAQGPRQPTTAGHVCTSSRQRKGAVISSSPMLTLLNHHPTQHWIRSGCSFSPFVPRGLRAMTPASYFPGKWWRVISTYDLINIL